MDQSPRTISRRTGLRGLAVGAAAALSGAIASCGQPGPRAASGSVTPAPTSPLSTTPPASPATGATAGGVLLAYFSRAGENYHYGGRRQLEVGNTEVLARTVERLLGCDLYRIQEADPYPQSYDAAVARNSREQDEDARPEIAQPLPSLDQYRTVLLASPVWDVRAPMIMTTFAEALDFTGKTVHPLTTHAVSGLGRTEQDYRRSCAGATFGEGLAVQGEEVAGGEPAVRAWLSSTALLRG